MGSFASHTVILEAMENLLSCTKCFAELMNKIHIYFLIW